MPSQTTTHGVTITFGTSGFEADMDLTSLDLGGRSRSAIETSHLGLTVYDSGVSALRTFIPGAFIDGGEITCGCTWTMADEPPISEDAEDITITFTGTGAATDGALKFSGFLTEYGVSGELDGKWEGTLTIKVAGPPSSGDFWTDAADV